MLNDLGIKLGILVGITITILVTTGFAIMATPPCNAQAAYCTPVTCISNAGCIAPCFCAKQQGEAFGYCAGGGLEP